MENLPEILEFSEASFFNLQTLVFNETVGFYYSSTLSELQVTSSSHLKINGENPVGWTFSRTKSCQTKPMK